MPGFRNIWPWQPDKPPEAGRPAHWGCRTHICLMVASEVRWERHLRGKGLSEHEKGSFSSNSRALIPSQRVPRTLGSFCLERSGEWPCQVSPGCRTAQLRRCRLPGPEPISPSLPFCRPRPGPGPGWAPALRKPGNTLFFWAKCPDSLSSHRTRFF